VLIEDIMLYSGDTVTRSQVLATNPDISGQDSAWLMIHHHGSPIIQDATSNVMYD
jgi:hypothetical protein